MESIELLKMEGITKIYGNGFMANKDVNFSVNKGEIHALVGENGAGKTTLMKILFGLENCQNGKIYIEGKEVVVKTALDAIDKGIGMVHQHFMQFPTFTVAENVVLGSEPGRMGFFDKDEAVRMTAETAAKFHLNVDSNALIDDVSVGVKQKVELLKALIRGAKILILDEPTAVLTPQETRELFEQLRFLRQSGYGIVFISHKLEEVMQLCDRCTVLRHGRVVEHGNIKDLNVASLSHMIVGRDILTAIDKPEATPEDAVLQVRSLNYIDEMNKWAVRNLSFGIRAGEILGIAGVEGNGQSELSEIITGLRKATDGSVQVNGKELTDCTINEIRQHGVSHISEDRMVHGCAPDLSVKDNIGSIYLSRNEFKKGLLVNTAALNKFVDDCILEFEIACSSRNDAVRLLSGGNIQKVIVAREFSCGSRLIVANQPTRGIDVGTSELIRKLLIRYTREKKIAVLLISSDLNEILGVSDRLLVMHNGKINAQFMQPQTITDEELGEYMLGIKSMSNEEMGSLF